MFAKNETDFLGLAYPSLIIGPGGLPFASAEIAWLAHFVHEGEALYRMSTYPREGMLELLPKLGILSVMDEYPQDYWVKAAYDVLLQKYERPYFATRLLQPGFSPENFPTIVFPAHSSATRFWYDNTLFEPPREGHLRKLSLKIRQELIKKYSQPLMIRTDIGKHLRAHNLAP